MAFLDYDAPNIDMSDVTLVEIIKEKNEIALYRARWLDKDCVLKVVGEGSQPSRPQSLSRLLVSSFQA